MSHRSYTYEEIKENRKAWIAALRSGDYDQTIDALKNRFGFCCLGVACDIIQPNSWVADDIVEGRFGIPTRNSCNLESDVLPIEIMEALGASSNEPDVFVGSKLEGFTALNISVTILNDTHHWSFDKIADALEYTWKNQHCGDYWRYE